MGCADIIVKEGLKAGKELLVEKVIEKIGTDVIGLPKPLAKGLAGLAGFLLK